MVENPEDKVILSAFLEKTFMPGDAKRCREYYWKEAQKSPLRKDEVKMSEAGPAALVQYIVKEHADIQVNQKNINAYPAKENYWVDVHLSKVDFKPEDEAMLLAIVKAIQFNEKFVPAAGESANCGSFFMSKAKYAYAIRAYEKAVELEKSHPTFNHKQQVFLWNQKSAGPLKVSRSKNSSSTRR
jgi:hypothetical protein